MSHLPTNILFGVLLSAVATIAIADGAPQPAALDCLLEPKVVIDVSSPVPGVIDKILVEKSSLIEKGQAIASLESSLQTTMVKQARGRATASADIEAATANLAFARRNFNRLNELFTDGAVASHHLDEARTELVLAESQLKKAQENREAAELDLQHAVDSFNQRTIRSPVTGVVVARYRSPGEFVEADPILQLATLNPLSVEVIAPARLFGSIQAGMQGTVVTESSSEAHVATVSLVDRVVDAASGTFGIRLELPNPDYHLPGGLKCKVQFTDKADVNNEPVLPVDQTAIVAAEPPVATTDKALCMTAGPLDSADQAARARKALANVVSQLDKRLVEETVVIGYLVLSPEQASLEQARSLRAQLQDSGQSDVALLINEPFQNRLSLGYYNTVPSAIRRRDALQAEGIDVAVVARTRGQSQIWLDFAVPASAGDSQAMVRSMQQISPDVTLSAVSCTRLASHAGRP